MFDDLAEKRIAEGLRRGEFDNLAGQGKPLPPDDARLVPEELRMAYRVLRNAGYAPPEIGARRELVSLNRMLAGADTVTAQRINRRISLLAAQLGLRPDSTYFAAVCERLQGDG